MKIAVPTDNGSVSEHFGRCPEFTIAQIEEGKIVDKKTIPNPGHHPGFLPNYMQKEGVEIMIAGGIGQRALGLFEQAGIKAVLGITGSIEDILEKAAKEELKGSDSFCSPGKGKGYGIGKTDKPEE